MTKDTADVLCRALDETGAEYERRDAYSGRGMYGETTVGIVLGDVQTLLGAVAEAAGGLGELDPGAVRGFADRVRWLRTDQMGRSDIIVY